MSNLRQDRNERLRKNSGFAIIIFVFLALLAAAFISVGLLWITLILVIIPLIVLPLFFSFQRAVVIMRNENETLSFRMIMEGFGLYYQERFNSNFGVVRTLLWGLLVYFISAVVTNIVINLSFYYTNFMNYYYFFNGLMEEIKTLNLDNLNAYLENYRTLLNVIDVSTVLPPLFITTMFALYSMSKSSISIFLRFSNIKYPGRFLTAIHQKMIKDNKGTFLKRYWSLNWPLYLLFIMGMGVGGYLGYLYRYDADVIYVFGLMGGVLISFLLYGPIYIANKEAIYISFIEEYKKVDEDIKKEFANSISQRMEALLKEQEQLQKMKQEQEKEDNQEIKNDSDESH